MLITKQLMKKKTAINNVYAHKQEALNNVTNAHSNSDVKMYNKMV